MHVTCTTAAAATVTNQTVCFFCFFPRCHVHYNCQAFFGLLGRNGSEGQEVRGQRSPFRTEGCIVDRKVKDTCGFRHVSVSQILSPTRWVSRLKAVSLFFLAARFLLPLCLRQRVKHVPAVRTHQADASDTALGDGALAHLRQLLPEEEIQLVVVPLGAVGDEVHVDERGVCGRGGRV